MRSRGIIMLSCDGARSGSAWSCTGGGMVRLLDNRDEPQPITGIERASTRLGVLRRSHSRTEYALRVRLKPKRLDISWRGIVRESFELRMSLAGVVAEALDIPGLEE